MKNDHTDAATRLQIVFAILLILLVVITGCEPKEKVEVKDDDSSEKVTISLPALSDTNTDLYVFVDCERNDGEIKDQLFKGRLGDFRLYRQEYTEELVLGYLEAKKYRRYSTTFGGNPSTVFYKGGTIKDKATFEGTAKTIVFLMHGVGWYRIK